MINTSNSDICRTPRRPVILRKEDQDKGVEAPKRHFAKKLQGTLSSAIRCQIKCFHF
jgi:hypothetical protein